MQRHAILLGISFLISKLLGLLRDNLLAAAFGAGSSAGGVFNLDIYYASFRLPDLLYNLLAYGVLSAAFVPLFSERIIQGGKEKAFEFSSRIVKIFGLGILALSLLLGVLAPWFIPWFVPGFSPEEQAIAVSATRLMLVTPFFFTIGSIAGGIQNAMGVFSGLALAPVLYNAGIVFGIVWWAPTHGVYGVAWGVCIGALLHMVSFLPGLLRLRFSFQWRAGGSLWNKEIAEMVTLALPRIFGMSVSQIGLLVNTILASLLPLGSITIYNFASNLESIPVGLIGISVAIVSFGTLSRFAAEGKFERFAVELQNNLRRILFLLIPLAVGMFMLRVPLVTLLLGRGRFGQNDILQTANTLAILLIGVVFGSLVFLLARGFYALKDTKTPVLVGTLAITINVVLGVILTREFSWGIYGLALAAAASNIANGVILFFLLRNRVKTALLDAQEMMKFSLSTSIMALMLFFIPWRESSDAFLWLLAEVAGKGALGFIVYMGVCRLLRCRSKLTI